MPRTGFSDDALRRSASRTFVLLAAVALAGCGGDAEERLHHLPARIAALIREQELDDAFDFLSTDFRAHDLNRHEVQLVILRELDPKTWKPYVVETVVEDPVEDEKLLRVIVLGLLVPGDPVEAAPARCRPFKLRLEARPRGRDWEFVSARLER